MLSNEQYQHFQTFGFLRLRSYFDAGEMATISGVVEAAWAVERALRPRSPFFNF